VVADDAHGGHDFYELLRKGVPLSFWCFDLLSLEDEVLCELPLRLRRAELRKLLPVGNLHFSEAFADLVALLQAAETRRLEGIVSKRADMPYRPGRRPEWIKVKTAAWRDANLDRYEKMTSS
jgi:bifunctional non-homologous end joining protein LigD